MPAVLAFSHVVGTSFFLNRDIVDVRGSKEALGSTACPSNLKYIAPNQ